MLLSLLIFLPLLGAIAILFIDDEQQDLLRQFALGIMGLGLLLSLGLWWGFDASKTGMQFVTKASWIHFDISGKHYALQYFLGLDGISLLLVMLTTFLGPLVILGSWNSIQKHLKGFLFCVLLLQTGMLGTFVALDLFLFYIFWELMLIPMYFIIGIWGGKRRIYAAVKLLLYTMAGSLLMLIGILYIGLKFGTFDLLELYTKAIPAGSQTWLFAFFALAFLIKVPMFPFHTWLPDAHVEAPTAGSVILAGVLLKMGTYGMIRFAMPLFPDALLSFTTPLMVLSVIGIIYGALVAMVQPDIKKLVAYSSVSHLGFVTLGMLTLNLQGMQGSLLQMVNHGLSTGGLFLMIGMLYERRHTRMIEDYGGIARVIPVFTFFLMVMTLSSIGLPGLNGFVGEFLILLGTWKASKLFALLAGTGIILGAVYMLWMFRRVMFGPITHEENRKIRDLDRREVGILVALTVFIVWIGLVPSPFLKKTTVSVQRTLNLIQQRQRTVRKKHSSLTQLKNRTVARGEKK